MDLKFFLCLYSSLCCAVCMSPVFPVFHTEVTVISFFVVIAIVIVEYHQFKA